MEFGELKSVDVRTAWPHEAHNFTPWLADNLERLSAAIGVPLESEGTEVAVGPFAADILARNPMDGSRVLIENQLETADHTHLGQILAYLAGLEAQTIIWVARDFQEPHLSAIRWLNEHTTDPYAFFAVRVRVVQIADSPLAPLFEVLERPSGWDRQVRALTQEASGGLSGIGQIRRDFWRSYAQRHPNDGVRDGHAAGNVWHPAANNQITIVQYLALSQHGVGIYISWPRGLTDEQGIQQAQPYRDAVAAALGVREDGSSVRRFPSSDQSNWPDMADWLHNQLAAYRRVIEETAAGQSTAEQIDDEGDA